MKKNKLIFLLIFIISCKYEDPKVESSNQTINRDTTKQIIVDSPKVKASDTIKEKSFKEFANEFVEDAFQNEMNFQNYSEDSFIVSSSDEDSRRSVKANAKKEYLKFKQYRQEYNKHSVGKDMIYFYEILEDMKIGMKFYFRKNSSGEWKLFKVYFDGL